MHSWDRAISRTLDNVFGGGFFSTAETPWSAALLLALALAWVIWVTTRCAEKRP